MSHIIFIFLPEYEGLTLLSDVMQHNVVAIEIDEAFLRVDEGRNSLLGSSLIAVDTLSSSGG